MRRESSALYDAAPRRGPGWMKGEPEGKLQAEKPSKKALTQVQRNAFGAAGG